MPDFYRNWHLWWLDFWAAHPILFWVVVVVAVALPIVIRRFFGR